MDIEILPISASNRSEALELKVKKDQNNFIETVAQCLTEADELSLWKPVGIYVNRKLVGFAMYGLWIYEGKNGRVWLDRFLIDEFSQGKGYATPVLKEIIHKITDEYGNLELFLSIYENNSHALELYKKLGFEFNGELDINGEKVMVLQV